METRVRKGFQEIIFKKKKKKNLSLLPCSSPHTSPTEY